MLKLHIEILKHPRRGFEVRVVDSNGCPIQVFRYPTIESARMGADARAVEFGNWYGNCCIDDKSGEK